MKAVYEIFALYVSYLLWIDLIFPRPRLMANFFFFSTSRIRAAAGSMRELVGRIHEEDI